MLDGIVSENLQSGHQRSYSKTTELRLPTRTADAHAIQKDERSAIEELARTPVPVVLIEAKPEGAFKDGDCHC